MRYLVFLAYLAGCSGSPTNADPPAFDSTTTAIKAEVTTDVEQQKKDATKTEDPVAYKLTSPDCIDPDLSQLMVGVELMLCDGTMAEGTYEPPEVPADPHRVCSVYGELGCLTTVELHAKDLSGLSANLKSGAVVAGVVGTYVPTPPPDCDGNGQTGCLATSTYKAFDYAGLTPGNLQSGVVIAGVTGTFGPENCAGNGLVGCVTTSTWKSADLSNLTVGNVRSGVAIAGVTGQYPSSNYPLIGADATADLTAATMAAKLQSASSFEWFGPDGVRHTAAGDADLAAGNVKSGADIFGVVGQYPSSSYKLAGADSTADLDTATFDAKIKAAGDFEWFDADGNRYQHAGDTDIAAANILKDVTIFGATGTVDPTTVDPWDVRKGITVNGVTGKLWLTCNYDVGAPPSQQCDGENWVDLTPGGCAASAANCMYQDRVSGLKWANSDSGGVDVMPRTWDKAVARCAALVKNGESGWRLPSKEEMGLARIGNIKSVHANFFVNGTPGANWTSSGVNEDRWTTDLETLYGGFTRLYNRGADYPALCVK